MNWRKLLYATSTSFLRICRSRSVSREKSSTPRCLIFDDTLLYKTGKVIEGVSKVYDHVSHCTHLGYKLLGMVYYDGISAILTDFSLHRELGKKGMGGMSTKQWKHQYHPKRSSSQPDCIRRQELDMSKMEKMYQMLRSAFRQGFEVDYVLTDNWFT